MQYCVSSDAVDEPLHSHWLIPHTYWKTAHTGLGDRCWWPRQCCSEGKALWVRHGCLVLETLYAIYLTLVSDWMMHRSWAGCLKGSSASYCWHSNSHPLWTIYCHKLDSLAYILSLTVCV